MLKRILVLFTVLSLILIFPVLAKKVDKDALDATHILIGKVKKVESYYSTNDWGDTLIYSLVEVKVEKKLKGKTEDMVELIVEGGTVGEITLKVSEYPLFNENEKIKLYLKKTDSIFKFIRSELKEDAKGKKPEKPGGGAKCCKTFAKWPDPNVIYHIDPSNNDGIIHDCVTSDITAGAEAWNSASGINLTHDPDNPGAGVVDLNGFNDIMLRDETSGSAIAVTYTWYYKKGRQIVEFDMLFFDGAWDFFSNTCSSSCLGGFYIQTIATHELGHAIGIDHNRCQTSIMYPYATYCDTNELSDDDVACVSDLYK